MRDIEFRAFVDGEMITPAVWINNENLPCYKLGSAPKVPLMQFTGLLDAKGNKVFEGDFLDYGDGVIKEVYWCQESCSFCANGRLCAFHFEGADIEIIGNIYQHPHLIKGGK